MTAGAGPTFSTSTLVARAERIEGTAIQLSSRVKDVAQRAVPPRVLRPAEGGAGAEAALPSEESFTSVVTAVRWATTAVSLLLFSTGIRKPADAVVAAGVLAYSLWRTVRPIKVAVAGPATAMGVVAEMAVMLTAVVATDYWNSFFVLGMVTAVCVAAFAGGIAFALPVAGASVLVVALPYHLAGGNLSRPGLTIQWAGLLLLVAIVADYARRITLTKSAETSAFIGRLHQLSEANSLLLKLHQVATTLPMSLDLNETLDSSVARLRELLEPDVLVVLLRDERGTWSAVRSSGAQLPGRLEQADLPPLLSAACAGRSPRLVTPLGGGLAEGLAATSGSGLYAPLWARQELVGLVALEHPSPTAFDVPQAAVLEAFVEQMAVSLDNARWFSRIGTLAVEEERSRIARDLHDRVGQSLALVGFELDRATKSRSEEDLRRQVQALRGTVRSVVSELRETLYDLRTDVSEEHDLGVALTEYLDRVGRRSELDVSLRIEAGHRWPLTVEREILRIVQESVTNAERHARARSLEVLWRTEPGQALLRVKDDGAGLPDERRPDGYGLIGMKERADAIGATLAIVSAPGQGTEIRVELRR